MLQLHYDGQQHNLPTRGKFTIGKGEGSNLVVKTPFSPNPPPYIEGGKLHAESSSNIHIQAPGDTKATKFGGGEIPLESGTVIYIGPPNMPPSMQCKLEVKMAQEKTTTEPNTVGNGSGVRLDQSKPSTPENGGSRMAFPKKINNKIANSLKDVVSDKYITSNDIWEVKDGYVKLRDKFEKLREEKKKWAGLRQKNSKLKNDVKAKNAEIARLQSELDNLKKIGESDHKATETSEQVDRKRTDAEGTEIDGEKARLARDYRWLLRLFDKDQTRAADQFNEWRKSWKAYMKDQKNNSLLEECAHVSMTVKIMVYDDDADNDHDDGDILG
uniref:Uncharacterized protein n=1 Tax=Lotharella globosa TaxID=91324 RepID=A0A7S3YQN9_9EUKA